MTDAAWMLPLALSLSAMTCSAVLIRGAYLVHRREHPRADPYAAALAGLDAYDEGLAGLGLAQPLGPADSPPAEEALLAPATLEAFGEIRAALADVEAAEGPLLDEHYARLRA